MFVLAHASSFLLRWLSTRPHVSDVHFFSDSSSSLKVIFKGTPHPSQSTSILFRTNFHHLFSALPNLRVHISWVPGHKGIAGMKIADSLAKKAAKAKGPRLSHAASCSGPLLEIERNAHSRWRDHRESHPFQESSSFFPASQSIRPSLKPPKWFKTISRPDYLHYTQFATGHGYTGEYYSQFVPKNPIHCNCDPSDNPVVQSRDHCHRPCFGVYAIVGFEPSTLKNDGSLLLLSQTVKLSGWSHGPSHALSHDRSHVPSPDHDSSPLMTRHVTGPYLSYLSATLLIGCHTFI